MNKKIIIHNNTKGFILAEVMIGTIIMIVAISAIAGLYLQSNKATLFADNRTIANNWAQERMEFLKSDTAWRGSTVLGTQPVKPVDNGIPPRAGFSRDMSFQYPAQITALPGNTTMNANTLLTAVNGRLIDTTVTVSWTENGIPKTVTLETLIEQN